MCAPAIPLALGIAGLAGAGVAAKAASQKAKAIKAATAQNEKQAAAEAQASEQQFNKANQKAPDIAAMMSRNQDAMKAGIGATFLTGSQGVQPASTMLGKSTLLGG